MRSPTRRLLTAAAVGLTALFAAYLVGANAYLRSGRLETALDRHPDHLFVRYGSAWTWWPGVVHLRALELHGQSRTVQWWFQLDRAVVAVDLPRLWRRELAASALDGEGVAFRLRRRPEALPGAPPLEQIPPIPGLVNTPAPPPPPELPEDDAASDAWQIRIEDVDLERLREVWIGAWRFTGDARVAGGFDLHPNHLLRVAPATATLRAGSLVLLGSLPVLDGCAGEGSLELPPFNPDRLEGGFLRLASGRLRLHGRLGGLGFLEPSLRQARWIEMGGSPGTVDAELRVVRGSYAPGTRIVARPGRIAARLLDDEALGSGSLRWDVAREKGAAVGRLVAVFDDFQLRHLAAPLPRARGRGLRVEIATRELGIAAAPAPAELAVDLPPTEVGDFSSYNAYLPRGAGIVLRSGTGVVSGSLRAVAPAWVATGDVDLRGRDVIADVEGSRLRGDLRARSRFRALPRERQLLLAQSDVELAKVVRLDATASPAGAGWWARAHLDYVTVRPGALIVLKAKVHSTLSDTRPLFALFSPRPKRILTWLDRLLDLHPIGAVGELTVGEGYAAVDGLAITSGPADVRARFRFGGGGRNGILYAAYGPLSVGMEMRGAQRDWKLIRARQWFESRLGLGWPAAAAR